MRKEIILPAGEYYIGDPCYIFYNSWDDILGVTGMFDNDISKYKGFRFFVGQTAYGDGMYLDNYGKEYPVDAGLIGILDIEMLRIDNRIQKEEIKEFGNIVSFDKEFLCIIEEGYFKFGNIEIETNWEDDDEYDDEDYDWDDDDDDDWDDDELDEHDKDYANFEHNHEER
jgi:hypothetical protein